MQSMHSLASLLAHRRPITRRTTRSPLAAYAGFWKGTLRAEDMSGAVHFTMRQSDVELGVHPTVVFPTPGLEPIAMRIIEASISSYSAVSIPFAHPSIAGIVTLHLDARRIGNRLVGHFALRREDGSVARQGSFTAVRCGPASQVNYRW